MGKILLEVQDESKMDALVELLKHLDLVVAAEKVPEDDYPEKTKEEILEGIRQGLKEAKLSMEGKLKLQTLDELLAEIEDES